MDYIDQEEDYSYSYSLNHNKKHSDNPGFAQLTVIIDYAPVKMILTRRHREFGQLMIDLCSIVGGVFVIFGLFNSFFLGCLGKLKG